MTTETHMYSGKFEVMDTSYLFDSWEGLYASKYLRVELLRQILHHVPRK